MYPKVIVGVNSVRIVSVGTQGPVGATGPSGSTAPPVNFSFGDASPAVISSGQPGQTILQISVNVLVPFDGAGASLSIGTLASPALFVESSQLDLTIVSEFEVNVGKSLPPNTDIVATINPGTGATSGSGWVLVDRVSS